MDGEANHFESEPSSHQADAEQSPRSRPTEGVQEETDIGADCYEVLQENDGTEVGTNMSKYEENLRLMLDPQYKESAKSLWRGLFEESLSQIPSVEYLKVQHSDKESDAYLEWYNCLLLCQRRYLQTALESPLALPNLSKRIANFLIVKQGPKLEWRQQWIVEYIKYRELAEKAQQDSLAKAKAEAAQKRQARLDARREFAGP